MKIIWLIFSLVLLLHSGDEKLRHDPFSGIEYWKLGNGMQVYLLADPKAERTRIRLTVNVGYDNETETNYGITHLVEHLVFRDRRIPHHDYLDYIQEMGGTDVNGYTKRYETRYTATLPADKSYWIVKNFSRMLFDKNVTNDDLEVERKALQTEIGELRWYDRPMAALKDFMVTLAPPQEDYYAEEFGLPEEKELPDRYHARENNQRFTLRDVMARYRTYYYPANMKLMVVGSFDVGKMRQQISESFGAVDTKGTMSVEELRSTPTLNGRPFLRFYEGTSGTYATLGAKYLLDDYKKYLILNIYTMALAERLQQKLRNKLGKTYSISEDGFANRHTGAALISFDGLPDVLSENIARAETMIRADREKMNLTTIRKAMDQYEKRYYASLEHDSETLMNLVDMADYLRKEHNITDQTSYTIFRSITPEAFQKTVTEAFAPQNRYKFVTREYYFFPADMKALSLVTFLLMMFVYFFFGRWQMIRRNAAYTQRDIVFQRRISGRFTGFAVFMLTTFLATLSYEWIEYLFSKWIMGDPRWLATVDVPYSYIITVVSALGYVVWFFILYRYLWRYYARMSALKDKLILIGNRIAIVDKERIKKVDIVSWRARAKGVRTFGTAWRFWLPLTALVLDDGSICYLRTGNALHLKEDIEVWLHSEKS